MFARNVTLYTRVTRQCKSITFTASDRRLDACVVVAYTTSQLPLRQRSYQRPRQ